MLSEMGRKSVGLIILAILMQGFLTFLKLDLLAHFPNQMSEEDVIECLNQFEILNSSTHPDVRLDIGEILTKYGYSNEEIIVETPEGYLLSLFHVSPKLQRNSTSLPEPVLLVHGMGANGFIFLIQPAGRNLPTFLADRGYDVFILSNRGTKYSLGHKTLDSEEDYKQYWNFSFHEMGVNDLPAVIDTISKRTGQAQMRCIAYSLGTTLVTALLTERPEFNDRFKSVVFLSPTVFLQHVSSSLKFLTYGSRFYLYPLSFLFEGRIDPKATFHRVTGTDLVEYCSIKENACGACTNMIFSRYGNNGRLMNYTTIPLIASGFPDVISLKTHIHVQQIVKFGKLCQFDYGFESENVKQYGVAKVPCYNLSNIRTPITIFWGKKDFRNPPEDVRRLWEELRPERKGEFKRVEYDYWNHVDFVIAKDADVFLYKHIVQSFLKQ